MILVGSSALMSPSCCNPNTNNSTLPYQSGVLAIPFPTNNYNTAFGSNPYSVCLLGKNTFDNYTIDFGFSTGYDISVQIYAEGESGYPNSGCFVRNYETSNSTLTYTNFGYVNVEYPTQQPYYIRIIISQNCNWSLCALSNNGTKRKMTLEKRITNGTLPNIAYMQANQWENNYSPYTIVTCSTPNIPQ